MLAHHDKRENRDVDLLSREELVALLGEAKELTRTRFTREWLERQSTEGLRLLVLAVQLYRVLLHQGKTHGAPPACQAADIDHAAPWSNNRLRRFW
jgi:hypothetical protein